MRKKVWHWNYSSLSVVILAVVLMGTSRCQTLPIDKALSAERGGAATVVLCGFGKCSRGLLFVQIQNTSATTAPIELKMDEKYKCGRDACVKFQWFHPDGRQGYSGSIPDGQDTARFKLGDVIASPEVMPDHDDEWLIKVVVWFKDNDGEIRKKYGFGFLRVNVVAKDYEFLSCGDPSTAWRVELKENCEVDYSTGFRSAICGHQCSDILGR
jgi:hypothetical protein